VVIANDPSDKEKELKNLFKNDTWFRYMEVPRESLYTSWNRGVEMANGEIIGFWNVDDVRNPEAVIEALRLFSNGAKVVFPPFIIKWYLNFGKISLLVKIKKITPPKFDKIEYTRSMHGGPFFLFTKELYKKIGPFDEQFKIVSDFDWCIRAAKETDSIMIGKQLAGVFRVDGNGISSGGKLIHTVENNVIAVRHNTPDKIIKIGGGIESKYKIDKLLFKGSYFDV